jgi:hypothetical protein
LFVNLDSTARNHNSRAGVSGFGAASFVAPLQLPDIIALTLDAKSRIKNTIVLSREWREIVTKGESIDEDRNHEEGTRQKKGREPSAPSNRGRFYFDVRAGI